MVDFISKVNDTINGFVWGLPMMVLILGVGVYLSIGCGFPQFRHFLHIMKNTLGKAFEKTEKKEGAVSPFKAMCTALAASIGTGNIAGVSGAIAIGGPGAVFWMWISALLGMCTKFTEVILAVHFREKNEHGDWVGGPMYYIKNGLGKNWKWMASTYALLGVLTVFGTGNATQVNTIVAAIDSALLSYNVVGTNQLSTVNLIIGIIIAITVALVLLGGIKRIGKVAEALVPFMALLYIILGLGVILFNISNVPTVFTSIFYGAFNPAAVEVSLSPTILTISSLLTPNDSAYSCNSITLFLCLIRMYG